MKKSPSDPESSPESSSLPIQIQKNGVHPWFIFFKTTFFAISFALIMLFVTFLGVVIWGNDQFNKFLKSAKLDRASFTQEIKTGWQTEPLNENGHKNILLLGTDSNEDRAGFPTLTDTIMLFSINLENGEINTLPLPRDLWNDAYQTKINALYVYGQERYPATPEQFTAEVVQEMTSVPIHHTVILSLNQLQELIDLMDGVEIDIKQGFTDALYPRSGVDVTVERDPQILYETIIFESGEQHLSGERALQYIRSRHSEDEQGHDLSRGTRQQQVIAALISKLTNYKLLLGQPELTAQLYLFYQDNFAQALSLSELVATVKTLLPQRENLKFTSHQLADIDDDPINGVLDNPTRLAKYQYQWVYIITNEQKFQTLVQEKLILGHN
ncbi:MAG: LCP family protein [Candidatus Paceibacterota bacterium]